MPEGGGIAMRTVWIALRATNYSEQAFRNAVRSVEDLNDAEKKERDNLLKTIDTAKLNMQTGVLYGAMLMMVTQRLGNLLQETQVGSMYMAQFNQTLSELKTSFADTLFTALKPLLDALQWFMNILKDNAPLRNFIVIGGLVAMTAMAIYSAYLVLSAAMSTNIAMTKLNVLMSAKAASANLEQGASVGLLGMSYKMLAASIAGAFAGFIIAYSVLKTVNPAISATIGIILALAAAVIILKSVLGDMSALAGLAIGGAAVGSLYAAYSGLSDQGSIPSYGVGTSYVPKTQMAVVHQGEAVLTKEQNNARSQGLSGGSNQTVNINMSGMILQTKMDKEEFIPYLKRELHNIATSK